jgi:hypothetical protein
MASITLQAGETTLKVEMYMEKLEVFELWTERIFSALERLLQDIECIEEAVREENLEVTRQSVDTISLRSSRSQPSHIHCTSMSYDVVAVTMMGFWLLQNTSRMYSGLLLAKMYSTVALLLEQVMGMAKPPDSPSPAAHLQQSPFCSVFKQVKPRQ